MGQAPAPSAGHQVTGFGNERGAWAPICPLSSPVRILLFSGWLVPPGGGTFTAPTLRGAFTADTQGGPASLRELHLIQVQ